MNHEQILSALNWRYATKSFDASKKISDADWSVLENSLILSPSSYGLQPWRFLIIQNPELRAQLRASSWNQSQVTDASHFVVFTTKEKVDADHIQKYLERISEVRGTPLDALNDFKKAMIGDIVNSPRAQTIGAWAQRQAYIAMGFLLETAALLKIDATPMEGLDAAAYDRILNLENTGYKTVAAVALGYRGANDPFQKMKKVRFAKSDLIHFV